LRDFAALRLGARSGFHRQQTDFAPRRKTRKERKNYPINPHRQQPFHKAFGASLFAREVIFLRAGATSDW
jgi:hypothetical protein